MSRSEIIKLSQQVAAMSLKYSVSHGVCYHVQQAAMLRVTYFELLYARINLLVDVANELRPAIGSGFQPELGRLAGERSI
jgi:hypothetical protein